MDSRVLQAKVTDLCGLGIIGLPAKIVLDEGDIVEVKDIRYSGLNGGEIHIIAGPVED